ncbi:MAG: spondin domain-containing protein [Gammaproteobacteria bacterium]|nr:spondin domain-containing protein [Gammaproteobacteria bacterium]
MAPWLAWLAVWVPSLAQAQPAESPVTYQVTFQGTWTTAATPGGLPGSAHFSPLIGTLHNDRVTFWEVGSMASPGVEDVAELGQNSAFRSEINASDHVGAIIERSLGTGGTPEVSVEFETTQDHPLVTLITMIAPSPDWFVGVSGLSLLDARGRWLSRLEVDLFPYDAGTENGNGFSLSNPATVPQGTITRIRGMAPFTDEPMARFIFVRQGAGDSTVDVPLFLSASESLRQGFLRLINHSDQPGDVSLTAIDDTGREFGPVSLALAARQVIHFNSSELEMGNSAKGLESGIGQGQGHWRLHLASPLPIEALAYVRAPDGFLSSIYDLAPKVAGLHRVSTFNPASNWRQASLLRLLNPDDQDAEIAIHGLDDSGAMRGPVQLTLPAGHARSINAPELEQGTGLEGALGDGQGKWRLDIEADRDIQVMSLMESPEGHITNLSSLPDDN